MPAELVTGAKRMEDAGGDAMEVLEELLCSVAGGLLPNRSEANIYSGCRSDLLQSPAKDLLPGFIYQCLTIFKFKDFITLFDPDVGLREAFIRRTFARCRSVIEERPAAEPSPDPIQAKLDPQQWML